jgi:putative transposase
MPRKDGATRRSSPLHQVEGGEEVSEVFRGLGVSERTFCRWKKQFTGLGLSELPELQLLRHENRKLKQVVVDPDARPSHPPGNRPKRAVRPRARCILRNGRRRSTVCASAAGLIPVHNETLRFRSTGNRQDALRQRFRELAARAIRPSTFDGVAPARGRARQSAAGSSVAGERVAHKAEWDRISNWRCLVHQISQIACSRCIV